MANWVAESVLEKEDSRKRAAIVKHFIGVADVRKHPQPISIQPLIFTHPEMSYNAKLLDYDCHCLRFSHPTHTPTQEDLGTSQCSYHAAAEDLRVNY